VAGAGGGAALVADACKALEQKIDAADVAIEALPKGEASAMRALIDGKLRTLQRQLCREHSTHGAGGGHAVQQGGAGRDTHILPATTSTPLQPLFLELNDIYDDTTSE
jgi:urease alpha subunit